MRDVGHLLELERCPYCSVHRPTLTKSAQFKTNNHRGDYERVWCAYSCANCGGVVIASALGFGDQALEIYPTPRAVEEAIPERAKAFLEQSISTVHAPAGSVMLAASAVDAMLKEKGYREGSLYNRIQKAADDHLITTEMAQWAHEVRLDANDQRHADQEADLPNEADAERVIEFALALAQFLFVLPQRVQRGIAASST
jgi:hypothetical protein